MRRTFKPPAPQTPPPVIPRDAWPWIAVGLALVSLVVIAAAGQAQRRTAYAECAKVCAPYAPWVSGLSCYCDTQRRGIE